MVRQYKDYSEWMRGRDLSSQAEYWKGQFEDEIPVLDVPTDFPRPMEQSFRGAVTEKALGRELSEGIRELAKASGATEYMILLSAAMVLLGKYGRQEDVVIGSPVSGRTHRDTESMLGMFVNTLAMRGKPEGGKSYAGFLQEIKETCLKAYENQEYPFEELVESIGVKRDVSRNPLFDVMLVLQNNEQPKLRLGEAEVSFAGQERVAAKFDMTFEIWEEDGEYRVSLEYCTDLYRGESAKGMLGHYETVLREVTKEPEKKISEIGTAGPEELELILKKFNDTKAEYPRDKTAVELFEEQAERTPEATAVTFGEESLTYGELNARANALGNRLRGMGVRPNDHVAIMAERSLEMVAGIYGILKSGGAYVPIDPRYPEERIRFMLEDSGAKALLTHKAEFEAKVPVIDLGDGRVWEGARENPERVNGPEDTAYCIYTSGTTGRPKGVLNRHRGLINRILWMDGRYPLRPGDAVLQKTTFTI